MHIWVRPQQAIIAMDTLALTATRAIGLYTSKLLPLPHLDCLICGTGIMPLVIDWFVLASTGMILRDIRDLDQHAPQQLQQLAARYQLDDRATTTIYQIGYDRRQEAFRAFAYRSSEDFQSEALPSEFWAIRPQIDLADFTERMHEADDTTAEALIIDMMERQRAEDGRLPPDQRVGIGGEIQIAEMRPGRITLSRAHRFADYEANWHEILKNLA